MSEVENYLIVNLPFEDNLNDNCGNSWKKNGSPQIKDCSSFTDINGNKLFNKACYFNGSNSYIYRNISLGKKDFTISFWVCLSKDKGSTKSFIVNSNSSTWFLIEHINNSIRWRSNYQSSKLYFQNNVTFLNTWHHLVLCYNNNEKKIYSYFNGKYQYELYFPKISSIISYEFTIGANRVHSKSCFTGYIKNFKIYNGIMIYNIDYTNTNIIQNTITINTTTTQQNNTSNANTTTNINNTQQNNTGSANTTTNTNNVQQNNTGSANTTTNTNNTQQNNTNNANTTTNTNNTQQNNTNTNNTQQNNTNSTINTNNTQQNNTSNANTTTNTTQQNNTGSANNTTTNTNNTQQNNAINNTLNININTIQSNNTKRLFSLIYKYNTNRQIRNGIKNIAFIINPYVYNLNDHF